MCNCMIVIVAAYSPIGCAPSPSLGASRKIEAVVSLLGELDETIILVNTAHNSSVPAPLTVESRSIGGREVVEIIPPVTGYRKAGKFINLLQVGDITKAVLKMGRPDMVWLYNAYAFESLFGRTMAIKAGTSVVLEMEDWHFSRNRGLNPKPFVDWACWRALMPHVTHAFSVNKQLANRLKGFSAQVSLFPGVVAEGIAEMRVSRPPFSFPGQGTTIGYFGGLSAEKGAGFVAQLVPILPKGLKLVVTGAGELEDEFSALAGQYKDQLEFHGRVNDSKLCELIGSCDVLLNPHAPIHAMADGIFPFKVIEGIASGRLVISTGLPSAGLEAVLQGVNFIDYGLLSLLSAVECARTVFESTKVQVENGAKEANRLFSRQAILSSVEGIPRGVRP